MNDHILRRIKQNTLSRLSVTSGTPRLLIIIFNTRGHIVMQDKTHVGFVNAHAKCVGRHNHLRPVVDKILLAFFAGVIVQTRMITRRSNAVFTQHQIYIVHIFSCRTIDNTALALVFFQIIQNFGILLLCFAHFKIQIFPVKSGD